MHNKTNIIIRFMLVIQWLETAHKITTFKVNDNQIQIHQLIF